MAFLALAGGEIFMFSGRGMPLHDRTDGLEIPICYLSMIVTAELGAK